MKMNKPFGVEVKTNEERKKIIINNFILFSYFHYFCIINIRIFCLVDFSLLF